MGMGRVLWMQDERMMDHAGAQRTYFLRGYAGVDLHWPDAVTRRCPLVTLARRSLFFCILYVRSVRPVRPGTVALHCGVYTVEYWGIALAFLCGLLLLLLLLVGLEKSLSLAVP